MELKRKWFEKKVDERQEMDLLKVEHFGFWLMYYMLLAAILIQTIILNKDFEVAAGEWIIFMSITIISLIGWIRKGVWGYHTRKVPGIRSCLLYSILTSIGVGTVFGLLFAFKWNNTSPKGIAVYIIMTVASLFVISCPAFLLAGALTKQREKRLAGQDFEEDDEEEEI